MLRDDRYKTIGGNEARSGRNMNESNAHHATVGEEACRLGAWWAGGAWPASLCSAASSAAASAEREGEESARLMQRSPRSCWRRRCRRCTSVNIS